MPDVVKKVITCKCPACDEVIQAVLLNGTVTGQCAVKCQKVTITEQMAIDRGCHNCGRVTPVILSGKTCPYSQACFPYQFGNTGEALKGWIAQ